jgi:AraC family transcriptional activator of pobA
LNSNAERPEESAPNLDFYGKDERWPTPERLHSEPLIDRSARHNWLIGAHRHNNQAQIFLLLKGRGMARLDSVRHEAMPPSVIVIPERCVHEFEWAINSDGFVLSIASPLIGKLRRKSARLNNLFSKPGVFPLEGDDNELSSIFRRIHTEYIGGSPLRELALETLLIDMAIGLARTTNAEAESATHAARGNRHFRRFLELAEQHHKSKWPVARYAGTLGISAPHLNAICKKSDGRSAKKIIHDRLLLAARRGLAYTDISIAGIANSLGFADASYFARFFRRFEGVTPSTYRRQTGTQSVGGRLSR